MKIEKIKIIDNVNNLSQCSNSERIYFGNEFCENKLHSLKDLDYIVSNVNCKKITLVYPFLTQKGLNKLIKQLPFIVKHNSIFDEIVFNDWGLFYFLKNNYSNFKLILGRLLTKQKTDPFANEIISDNQHIVASDNNIFIPRKVSNDTKLYFSQTLITSKIFQEYLIKNDITRVEIDNVIWPMNISLPKEIKVSLYYPNIKITTTRFCGYLNMLTDNCSKQCETKTIILNKYRSPYKYMIKGNTVYYKNKTLPNKQNLEKNSIDRIILND